MTNGVAKLSGGLKRVAKRLLGRAPVTGRAFAVNRAAAGKVETRFETSDGRLIPVQEGYRYGLKKAWQYYGPVSALAGLREKGVLKEADRAFLKKVIGTRTLGAPLAEARAVLAPYLASHADLFVSTDIADLEKRPMKPSADEVERRIRSNMEGHARSFETVRKLGIDIPAGGAVMEIGYTSGGESIIAFERMGHPATGLEYFFGGSIDKPTRFRMVADLAGAKVRFREGDITARTEFDEGEFAVVHTVSVMEHIENSQAAFEEMFRILAPGGVMVHRYDPYFHPVGAHSLGTLDSPWAHMRMTREDMERYIADLRPNEADVALPWIRSALNRAHPQHRVQRAAVAAGFRIAYWQSIPAPSAQQKEMTSEILRDCLSVNADVTLDDLLSKGVFFVAQKPY